MSHFSAAMALFVAFSTLAGGPAEQLHALFDARFQWLMQQHPEMAMARGDYSGADRITDHSLQAIATRHQQTVAHLATLRTIERADLSPQDRLNYDLFALELQTLIDGHRFRTFLAPVGGRFGPQQAIPQMHERVRFETLRDYENYLARLECVPQWIDAIAQRLRMGVSEGRVPPKVCLLGVPRQFNVLLQENGIDVLATPLENTPHLTPEQRDAITLRFRRQTLPAVRSALTELQNAFADYLPHCRDSIAAGDWPDGPAYYAHELRKFTTIDLGPQAIHALGLEEVTRIRNEMLQVIRRSDFMKQHAGASTLAADELFRAFIHYLRTDPRFYHDDPQALLSGYRDICKRVDAWLPKFFQTLPRLPYGVREIPAFMAPSQTTAYYSLGDIRNGEPGYFYANTHALDQRPKYEMIALAMHEAVPGHHLQIALAQELPDVPEFRRDAGFTAFVEGWALYSERLGIEMGLYEDPYDDFGRLLYEMWRACRLVVDPGMHALGWSRERAVQFMLDHTALSELNVNTEIDRYIAWPGQATAYKIGELEIRALRRRAEQRLGEAFDIRAFHDVILGAGALPLSILKQRVNDWINKQHKPRKSSLGHTPSSISGLWAVSTTYSRGLGPRYP